MHINYKWRSRDDSCSKVTPSIGLNKKVDNYAMNYYSHWLGACLNNIACLPRYILLTNGVPKHSSVGRGDVERNQLNLTYSFVRIYLVRGCRTVVHTHSECMSYGFVNVLQHTIGLTHLKPMVTKWSTMLMFIESFTDNLVGL